MSDKFTSILLASSLQTYLNSEKDWISSQDLVQMRAKVLHLSEKARALAEAHERLAMLTKTPYVRNALTRR